MATRVKKTKVGCGCLEAAQKEAAAQGFAFETAMQINFDTGKARVAGPFLSIHWAGDKKSRKRLPTVTCAYCPFCGKRGE